MRAILPLIFVFVILWQLMFAQSRSEVTAVIIAAFGMASFGAPELLNAQQPPWGTHIEFPTADANAWMLDRAADIYIGSAALGRIQKYTPDGHFERGWFVDAAGGTFNLAKTSEGTILVCMPRRRKSIEFTPTGELMRPVRG